MNRAQRRANEREEKKEVKRNTISMSRKRLSDIKDIMYSDATNRTVDIMLTSFGLTLHEDYGFDLEQIQVCLAKITEYMDKVNNDECTVNDLRTKLVEETGLLIASDDYYEEEYRDGIYNSSEE